MINNTLELTLEEAKSQLAEKSARVSQIRGKLAEMRTLSMGVATRQARNEAVLAEAVLSGQNVAEVLDAAQPPAQGVTPAAITPSEARRVVSGLEHLLATALDEENQAQAAVRRASIGDLKALLEVEKRAYDTVAQDLMHRWARVTEAMAKVAGVTGMQQHSLVWASIRLPRAIPPKHVAMFHTGELWCQGADDIRNGAIANRANSEIAELLRSRGIGT